MLKLPRPSDLGVPHETWRTPQEQLFSRVLDGDCPRWVFAKAPPGTGKSAFAVGLARLSGVKTAILTRTHSLMGQYNRLYGVPMLRGRGNFPCILPYSQVTAAEAPCSSGKQCSLIPQCPYYIQRNRALDAPIFVTSYAYYLTDAIYGATIKGRFPTVICDEGHNLIGDLSRFETMTVPADLARQLPLDTRSIPRWATATLDLLPEPDEDDTSKEGGRLRSLRKTLNRLRHIDPDAVYLRLAQAKGAIQLAPLWPTRGAERYFNRASRVIVMSATLHPGGVIPRVMGVDNWGDVEVASTFPKERRPFYYWPQGKASYSKGNSEQVYRDISRAVSAIIHRYPESKGLIHVSSFYQAGMLHRTISAGSVPIILHSASSPGGRAETMERFRKLPPPAWLISPSAFEGQDFPDDDARVQVIAKTLFLDLSDPVTKARADDGKLGRDWYRAEAANRVTQAYGRVMRSDNDWGFTYGLDGTLIYLTRGRVTLPQYVMEAWIPVKEV